MLSRSILVHYYSKLRRNLPLFFGYCANVFIDWERRLLSKAKTHLAMHRLVRLRHRYVWTRSNRLRLRYVSAVAVAFVTSISFGLNSLAVPFNHSLETPFISASVQNEEPVNNESQDVAVLSPDEGMDVPLGSDSEAGEDVVKAHLSDGIRLASQFIQKPVKPKYKELEIGSGQTVAGLLQDAGLSGSEAYYAVKALGKYVDPRKVRSGQRIGIHYAPDDGGDLVFSKMDMKLNPVKLVSVTRNGPQDFYSSVEEKELVTRQYARHAEIKTSLYGSAALANIPPQVIAELIRIYSWDIDFQRDIRRGDNLELLYETFETEDGEFAKYGDILYANLSVGGKNVPIYRFEMNNGQVDYFQPDGMSIRKTLMKTPVDGARISSGFGMRKHPVLGYSRMHKGMDFAAPTGTPIYAAGDGVVEHAGRLGSFGNYIRIRHNSKLKTAYAHLHKIKSTVRKGSRVEQGQIIGYVGTTGRSTGPHLHYEVHVNGKQVNPRSVDLPTGEQLIGKDKQRFDSLKGLIYQQYVELQGDGVKVANIMPASGDELASANISTQ